MIRGKNLWILYFQYEYKNLFAKVELLFSSTIQYHDDFEGGFTEYISLY